VLAALTLTACGTEAAGDGSGSPGGTVDGDWMLVDATVAGEPLTLPDDRPVTLTVAGDDATGTSGCNSYFGVVEINGASVQFTGLGGTEMACEPDVMVLEQAYLAALGDVREAAIDGEQLVLTGNGVELRFDPVEPVEPAALVGTTWVLETVNSAGDPDGAASSAVGKPAMLVLSADGTVTGSTGCNDFGGTYEETTDGLVFSALAMTQIACPGDIAAQEAALIELFAQPMSVSIDGEVLTLTAPDGSGLVYRAQDSAGEPDQPDPETTPAGWWLLREGTSDGEPIKVGDHRITLSLTDTSLFASAGCNELFADVVFDGAGIDPAEPGGGIGGTDMLCEGLMELEAAYRNALTLPLTYERSGDRLVLRGDHGELNFDRQPDLDPSTIVGRKWVLDSLLSPDGSSTPAVGEAELVLADDGTFTGFVDGCHYGGDYVIEGDHVSMPNQSIDGTCPGEPVSNRVFAAQESGFVPIIDGDTMTIVGTDGAGIVYVAERPVS
jgi:heat shock protein HslJ